MSATPPPPPSPPPPPPPAAGAADDDGAGELFEVCGWVAKPGTPNTISVSPMTIPAQSRTPQARIPIRAGVHEIPFHMRGSDVCCTNLRAAFFFSFTQCFKGGCLVQLSASPHSSSSYWAPCSARRAAGLARRCGRTLRPSIAREGIRVVLRVHAANVDERERARARGHRIARARAPRRFHYLLRRAI
jgi:hypothetical protein